MNFYNFHVNDFRGATWHLNRLQRSIYRDLIDEYYLQEKPLTNDVAVLAHKMGCHSDEEKAALVLVLGEFFHLHKGKYHHKRINREIKNYQFRHATPATRCNDVTQNKEDATQHATDMQRECNDSTQRSRKKRLREKLLKEFGLNPDKSMPLQDLQDLYHAQSGNTTTQHATNATQHATEMQRECNGKNEARTKNQEPITKKEIQQQQSREDKIFRQPENQSTETETPIVLQSEFDRFPMHSDWQPHDLANVNALLRRAKLPDCETGLILDAMIDFVAYWSGRPQRECTAAEWDADFVKSAVKFRTKYGHDYDPKTWAWIPKDLPQNTHSHTSETTANAGSKTRQSLDSLTRIRQEIESGRIQFALPENTLLAIVDGLTSLVGARLKYPPPADAWSETITEWFAHFERCKNDITPNDFNPIVNAENVAQAFREAKKSALAADENQARFPTVRDVIAHLPKQLVGASEKPFAPSEKSQAFAKDMVKNMMAGLRK